MLGYVSNQGPAGVRKDIGLDVKQSRENAQRISIDGGHPLSVGDRCNGTGRVKSDAPELPEPLCGRWDGRTIRRELLHRSMQVEHTPIITKTFPVLENFIVIRPCQGDDIRKAIEESIVVSQHGIHARLL